MAFKQRTGPSTDQHNKQHANSKPGRVSLGPMSKAPDPSLHPATSCEHLLSSTLEAQNSRITATIKCRGLGSQAAREAMLGFKPQLSLEEQAVSIATSCLPAATVTLLGAMHLNFGDLSFANHVELAVPLFGASFMVLRQAIYEQLYMKLQRTQEDVSTLADRDALFLRLPLPPKHAWPRTLGAGMSGVAALVGWATLPLQKLAVTPTDPSGAAADDDIMVHAKAAAPAKCKSAGDKKAGPVSVHMFHGFGANLYSYKKVQQPLVEALGDGALVTAHDMPGFGLTERPEDVTAYSTEANARLGLMVANAALEQQQLEEALGQALLEAEQEGAGTEELQELKKYVHSHALCSPMPSFMCAPTHMVPPPSSSRAPSIFGCPPSFGSAAASYLSQAGHGVAASEVGSRAASIVGAPAGRPGKSFVTAKTTAEARAEANRMECLRPELLQRAQLLAVSPCSSAALCNSSALRQGTGSVGMQDTVRSAARDHEESMHSKATNGRSTCHPAAWDGAISASGRQMVLVGHSMGGICASLAALEHAKEQQHEAGKPTLVVLCAPAVFAEAGEPWDVQLQAVDEAAVGEDVTQRLGDGADQASLIKRFRGEQVEVDQNVVDKVVEAATNAVKGLPPLPPPPKKVALLVEQLKQVGCAAGPAAGALLGLLALKAAWPLVVPLLRSAVRDQAFWQSGLGAAVYDTAASGEFVSDYQTPIMVKGWEDGFLHYAEAGLLVPVLDKLCKLAAAAATEAHTVAATRSLSARKLTRQATRDLLDRLNRTSSQRSAASGAQERRVEEEGDVAARLAAACACGEVRVLIVHGENDKVVPVANSRKLAKLIPGAELVELSQCGHMPQEEHPELFTAVVAEYVERQQRELAEQQAAAGQVQPVGTR